MKKNVLFLIYFIFLSGCSVLSPVKSTKINTYLINRLPTDIPQKKTHGITLLVMPPITRPIYNTTQMAYTIKPFQIDYFSQNQWAETPSQMLLPLLLDTLQQTHYIRTVVTPPYIGKYDYLLNIRIMQLQQDLSHQPNVIRLSMQAQLSQSANQQVMATKLFSVTTPINDHSPYGGVIAANRATATILKQITEFCLKHLY